MATLTMSDGGDPGLPLQLTTITVAVPGSPLSPGGSLLTSMVGGPGLQVNTVNPLTALPVTQAETVKWKYEPTKPDKVGTTLVRCVTSHTQTNVCVNDPLMRYERLMGAAGCCQSLGLRYSDCDADTDTG